MASKNPLEQMAAWLGGGPADPLAQLTNELHELLLINQTQAHSTQGNARAKTPSGGSVFGTIGKAVEGIFGAGLGLSPVLIGLMALFGGGGESEPPALVKFTLPPAVSVNAGVSGGAPGIVFPVDYGQGSQVRPVAGGRRRRSRCRCRRWTAGRFSTTATRSRWRSGRQCSNRAY